jgi:hypothetical protein
MCSQKTYGGMDPVCTFAFGVPLQRVRSRRQINMTKRRIAALLLIAIIHFKHI